MAEYSPTRRSRGRRLTERISYDADLVHAILDEALISHVGFDADGPLVLPVIHGRIGDMLYLHVSTGSGTGLQAPADVCLTATIIDALVLAKGQFNHSMNYRSVVVRGRAEIVTDPAERDAALAAIVDHVSPGRSTNSRPGDAKELAATRVLRIALHEVSAKVRAGPAKDEEQDLGLPYWAGVIPVGLYAGAPQPSPQTAGSGLPEPALGDRFR